MVFFNRSPLCDQEPSTSDDTVFIKDLPDRGCLSGLDVTFAVDTPDGGYGAEECNILDQIKKLEIVLNGDIRLFSMTGMELFQHLWVKNGKPPWANFVDRPSDTAMITFPIRFGRYLGDPQFGLNLGNWRNAQLLIDYTLTTGDGTTAAEAGYDSGTAKISAMMHITPPDKTAPFRACIGTRQFYTHASTANEIKRMPLPLQNPIIGIGLYNHLAATSQDSTVLKAHLGLNNDDRIPIRGRWYDHVRLQAEKIVDNHIPLLAQVDNTQTLDLLCNWIVDLQIKPLANNSVPSASEFYHVPSFALSGGQLTWGVGHKFIAASHDPGAVTLSALRANIPMDVLVTGYPDRYIYWPMGDPMTMEDIINPGTYNKIEAVVEEGATGGATESLIVEELRPA